MKAVIHTGGKQYLVAVGDRIQVERLKAAVPDEMVTFSDIRLVIDDQTTEVPVEGSVTVTGKLISELKTKKVHGVKFKRRRRYLHRIGHRQQQHLVEITAIETKAKSAK